ncbi:MAG: gliding motility protein GldM, partial [Prevotellaceae bacterium]|nr:gliding motility protein GldM [Prevotellaceae bacterium]
MSGAKNCPETPRQKMIAMMYLVLTAMLALNVSADILKGFTMVNKSLLTTIESTEERNDYLMESFAEQAKRYPDKIGPWLIQANDVKTKSDDFYEYIKSFKYELIKLADGKNLKLKDGTVVSAANIDEYEIDGKDKTEPASNYGLTNGHGVELKKKIDDYCKYVKGTFDPNDPSTAQKLKDFDRLFSTEPITGRGLPVKWVDANFESMPLAAAITMLSKLQSDVKSTETELITYLKNQTDAGDYRVNEVSAVVIPDSKTVVSGTSYRARIMLAARDTNARPEIFVNGITVTDRDGWFTTGAGAIGTHPLTGKITLKDPITGKDKDYPIKDEYSVVAPSTTIANQDMNVVYMGYANRMSISAPGFTADKLTVSATNAKIERSGDLYICRPSSYDGVTISVTANVDGRSISMGSQKFRVRALPNPTIFLRYKNAAGDVVTYNPDINKGGLTRQALQSCDVIAEYADGLLQASFTV